MLIRSALIAFALLCCASSAAQARLSGGGTSTPAVCPVGSPSPDGSTITPNNLSCTLIDSLFNTWQFSTNGQPNNSILNLNTTPAYSALSAHYCASIGAVFFNVDYGTLTGQPLGQFIIWQAGSGGTFQNGLCNLATANARNVTTSTNYGMPKAALAAAANGQTITTTTTPAGIPFFVSAGGITANNVTFSPAPGAKFATSSGVQPSGILTITGTGATVNGGEYEFQDNAIRIASAASGATLDGSVVPLILHDSPGSCLLTGSQEGNVTVKELIVHDCATAGGGQDHNAYFSTNGTSTDNSVINITGIRSYDVHGTNFQDGGWTLKMRPGTSTVTGSATNYYIGCTKNGTGCEQNGVVDYPCFGNHSLSNLVLERGPFADNWYNIKAGEEISPSACPGGYSTNHIAVSNVILIDDSPSLGASIPGSAALCMGGGICTSNANSPSSIISTSVLIRNPSGLPMTLGPAVTDGGGNTIYASRQNACDDTPTSGPARGFNWHNLIDIFGNNSGTTCAFPWVPPWPGKTGLETALIAMAPDSFKLISTGTDGGFSTVGTPNDCAHFDGGGNGVCGLGGSTWPSLASLQTTITGPVALDSWAFSGAGIRASDHIIGHHGGGHQITEHDSGFYTFDVDAAATALCTPTCFTGSRTGHWTRVVDAGRVLDTFNQSRPAWSPQQSEGTNTSPNSNAFYWVTTNPSGQQMWDSCHSYHSVKPIPGTNYFDIGCGFIFGSSASIGAHWMVDTSQSVGTDKAKVIGPYVLGTPVGGITGATGLAGSVQGTACFDSDGTAYTFGNGGSSFDFFKWNNPTASNYSLTRLAFGGAHDPLTNDASAGQDCVVIADPTNASLRAVFIYNNLSPGTLEWWMVTGLAGGTPTINAGKFSGGIPTNCATAGATPTLNTVNGTILMWVTGHICKITPSATLANITISEITVSPTGDIPTTAGQVTDQFFHFPSADGLVLESVGQVWLYRCKNAGCT